MVNLSPKELQWDDEDNWKLLSLTNEYKCRNWKRISSELGQRHPLHTFIHFRQAYDIRINAQNLFLIDPQKNAFYRKFLKNEDEKILSFVAKHGDDCWFEVCHHFKDRSPCRLRNRYFVLLRNQTLSKAWTAECDLELIRLHKRHGGSYSPYV